MTHLFSFMCTLYLMGWILSKDADVKREARGDLDQIKLQHTKLQVQFMADQLLLELESEPIQTSSHQQLAFY